MPESEVPVVWGIDPAHDGGAAAVYVAPVGTAVNGVDWADLGYITDDGLPYDDAWPFAPAGRVTRGRTGITAEEFNELLRERYPGYPFASGGRITSSGGGSGHVHIDMRRGCPPPSYHRGPVAWDITAPPGYQAATVRQSYAARATTPTDQVAEQRPAPAGGVDDLTASIEGLCACPCRRPLDPDGPSAYFYDQGCQREWARTTHADRPDDVERSPDWMPGYMDTAYHHRGTDPTPIDMISGLGEAERRALTDPELAYRRRCAGCDVTAVPDTTERVEHQHLNIDTERAPGSVLPDGLHLGSRLVTTQRCANCGEQFDGPVYTGSITDEPGDVTDAVRLRLTDGTFWTSYALDVDELRRLNPARREAVVSLAWRQMQLQLADRQMIPDPLRIRVTDPGSIFLVGMPVRNPRASIMVTDVP